MADNKNIDNKIRESFEGLNRSAPQGLWEDLSENLDISKSDSTIDERVKEGFQHIDKSAPDHIWGGVNRALNIDRVWRRVTGVLDRRAAFKRWARNVAAALLLLLLSWGGYRNLSNQQTPIIAELEENNATISEKHVDEQRGDTPFQSGSGSDKHDNPEIIIGNGNDLSQANPNLNDNTKVLGESNLRNVQSNKRLAEYKAPNNSDNNIPHTSRGGLDELIPRIDAGNDEIVVSPAQEPLSEMTLISPVWVSTAGDVNGELAILLNISDSSEAKFEKRRRFEIGLTYSYNNTWLLNNETTSSFRKTSLVTTTATYAHSYGLMANYNFNKKNAVSTEFYINARAKQDYGVYVEGRYYDKEIELNYSKITLLYQRNILQPRRAISSRYTVKAGGFLGLLKNKHRYYDNKIVSSSDSYANIDYGVKLAVGQEKELRNVILGYGLNSEYGFKNIFAGNDRIPADFDDTHTFIVGGYITLRYKF
ncbi:MAG: hypothetical protein COB88_05930 [Flavobacteriales bacterium]|nr:MAG: hypothetical protein COB88_05930 [Flavobacteriales bacterium]